LSVAAARIPLATAGLAIDYLGIALYVVVLIGVMAS